MITHSHYDRDTLARFLDEVEPPHDSDIAIHVEKCVECQSTMESLLGDGLTMEAAGELLRESAESLPADDLAWESTDSVHTAETARRSFLDPSEHPNSLGRFARFEIMEILGRGGMGIVMRGYDTSLNRHSAVKVLAPELATSAAARKRFSREAKSAAAVVHPHVVPIHSVDVHNGLPYLVMPVVEGQSVDARVRSSGPVQVIEAVRIAAQVAEGLAAAHEQGLVHRDIKPANVLLENGVERVQITDFGLARAIDDASMTRSGVIAGTPQYMSPEQAHGDSIDHRSDLFSLGSLIYFMLTGHSPFRAETTMGVLNRIGNEQPRSLRSINAEIPEWFESVVMKLLAKSPDERFQSASEVAELLEGCLAHAQNPTATPLPEIVERLFPIVNRSQSVRDQPANLWGQWFYNWPPIGKFIATAAFAAALVFAAVLIVLELDKGTLTIESEADDIPIRIMQGGEVVKQLTVTQGDNSVRVASGNYVVVVDGEFSDIHVDSGTVSLGRGGTHAVRIVQSATAPATEHSAKRIARRYYDHLYDGRELEAKSLLASDARAYCSKHKWFIEARSLVSKAKPHDPQVVTRGDNGIAVFDAMTVEPTHPDIGNTGCLCLQLVRTDGSWRITDVDIWAPNVAYQALEDLGGSAGTSENTRSQKQAPQEADSEHSDPINTPTAAEHSSSTQSQVIGDESRLIQRLQGKWRVVRIVDPKGADYKPRKVSGWTIEGHNLTTFGEESRAKLRFTLDETQVPAQFDVLDLLGLIDVTGDTLKLVNSQDTGGESDPIRPEKLEPALGFNYCEMERMVDAELATLDDAVNDGHGLFRQQTTEILTPDQAKVHGFQRLIKLGGGQIVGTSSVTVRFRVASVAKQIRYGDYSAWYLCPSEKPTELGRGVLKVWIWPAVETALKEQGITDLEAHFVGKTVSVSGVVLSNPNPGPILYGGATPPWPRGGPQNAAHSIELESLDQLTVAPPDAKASVLAALEGSWQELDHEEGEDFRQTLVFTGGALGQWYQTAGTHPVSIAYYLDRTALVLQFYDEPERAFVYRTRKLRFDYTLDGDSLSLTREGVASHFQRVLDASANTPAAQPNQAVHPNGYGPAVADYPMGVGANPPTPVRTLAQHVDIFNRKAQTADGDFSQPALTVDEVLCFARWKLETEKQLNADQKTLLTNIGIGRWLPEGWEIEGGQRTIETPGGDVDVYRIQLLNRLSDERHVVRERFLAPPAKYIKPAASEVDDAAMPLSAATTQFNAMHNQVDGLRQPPLTLEEVLAAIVDWSARRSEAPVDNETFARFQEIAKTHQLPADAKFEVISSFGAAEGGTFKIWSVRILMPQAAKPEWTYAFTIRTQYLNVNSAVESRIYWGKPNDDGLQVGVRLIPSQRVFQATQAIETEFLYRSISGKSILVTLPNIRSHKRLLACDANGNELDVVEVPDRTIGGAVQTSIGETPTRNKGKTLRLGLITPDPKHDSLSPQYTYLNVKGVKKVVMTYVVSDFSGGELGTSEVAFDIAELVPAQPQ